MGAICHSLPRLIQDIEPLECLLDIQARIEGIKTIRGIGQDGE
jgi:hypothetical protein